MCDKNVLWENLTKHYMNIIKILLCLRLSGLYVWEYQHSSHRKFELINTQKDMSRYAKKS